MLGSLAFVVDLGVAVWAEVLVAALAIGRGRFFLALFAEIIDNVRLYGPIPEMFENAAVVTVGFLALFAVNLERILTK